MSRRTPRPIVPAPAVRPRYPRARFVWSAFAAGGLSAVLAPAAARADCSLPAPPGTVDPGTTTPGAIPGKKAHEKKQPAPPRQLPGKIVTTRPLPGEPAPVTPPVEGKLGGVVAPVEPPIVAPQGGPARATPPPPPGRMAPTRPASPPKKPAPVQMDGDVAHVGPLRYIHTHGPDEPCHPPGAGRLIIRFT